MKIEEEQKKFCTVIIPALNEELTIKNCVTTFKKHPSVKKVIVVANACNDKTAIIAKQAGAIVVQTKVAGKGLAIMSGIKKVDTEIVILCDGDLKNPSKKIIDKLLCGYSSNITLDKHPDHQATNKIARAFLRKEPQTKDMQYCFWGKDKRKNKIIKLNKPNKIKIKAVSIHKTQPINKYIESNPNIFIEESFYSKNNFEF